MRGLEFSEVKFVACDAEVFDDVRNDAARHVARMPRERDEAVGAEGIGVMSVAARGAQQFAADLPKAPLQLAAIVGRVFAHGSGSEDEFVSESGRNRASGVQQRFQMDLGSLLKTKNRLAPVASMRVAAGQQAGLGDPHAILIAPELHLRERNDHSPVTVTRSVVDVKRAFDASEIGCFLLQP